jgi:ubiquinone/menaquinone biosynthesis C-methylase UbiE
MHTQACALNLDPPVNPAASESLVRMMDAQTRAIWPQELPFIERYALPEAPRILDAGCGTGEVTSRLADRFPTAQVLGVDIIESSLQLARLRHSALAPRLSFEQRSIFTLDLPSHSFDLTICRHVTHTIPHVDLVMRELARVTRPGGYLHVVAEDYGMIHFEQRSPDLQAFWHVVADRFTSAARTDMYSGRHLFGLMSEMALEDIRIDYVVVDTLRVDREVFAAILEGWRDSFATTTAEVASIPHLAVLRYFEQMIGQVRDPTCYVVWMMPVVSSRIPVR